MENKKEYEKPLVVEVSDIFQMMEKNAEDAERIEELIIAFDKNLFNDQRVIDWQDRLNAVSISYE